MRYCNAGGRCRDKATHPDGTKRPARIESERGLCEQCTEHIRKRCVESWLTDYAALRVMLGERASGGGEHVRYTPNPGIPLSTEPEKLMVDLQFYAELAAEMVSTRMNLEWPPTEAKAITQPGFLERWNTYHPGHELTSADRLQAIGDRQPRRRRSAHVLAAAMQRVAPYLEELLEVEPQPVILWATGEAIDQTPVEWRRDAPRVYTPLDQHGRQVLDKGRVLVELSGVDVATRLRDLHELVRGYYGARGKDRADHMQSPCWRCGNQSLYRDHGTDMIVCRKCPPNTEGARGWSKDDYDRLVGNTQFHLKVREEHEMDVLKWLVAEREWERACAAWVAAERLHHLERAAAVAGLDMDDFIAALDRVPA